MLDHVFDLIGVEHREHDGLAVTRDFGERAGAGADRLEPRVLRRIDVEADHGKSRSDQPPCVDLAHQADAD